MKLIDCRSCGSTEFFEDDGYSICVYCQSKYVPLSGDAPAPESVIELKSDVEVLLEKCKVDPINRRRLANLILDIDPHNQEARQYLN